MPYGAPGAPSRTIATGTYTGNGAADRQIVVGFKCSLVKIIGLVVRKEWTLIPSATYVHHAVSPYHKHTATPHCRLHASDGFYVDDGGADDEFYANENTEAYFYWAISE